MQIDWAVHFGDIVAAVGVIVTLLTFVLAYLYGKRKDRESDNEENYQRLELASMKIFQNEIDHPDLSQIWDHDRKSLAAGPRAVYFYDAFLYQHLNLFEMAYSFSADGEFEPEVFGSWVLWIANVCRSPYFRDFWTTTEAPQNYVHEFQEIMNEGCRIYARDVYRAGPQSPEMHEKHRAFFRFIGAQLQPANTARAKAKLPPLDRWLDWDQAK
jgi:uncharacterized protein DUF6082